ncbi:MAG TPA: UvrD-helicase domain-containing protein, partial [Candidatus Polarisedimenticolia bacterium]|nr:UvrD-helicase domain-containing protein [Candidatus Polarisedimenticolia bacterium]
MSTMTPSQQAALNARGNVLVIAGAGTGKTHTLIERCCSLLLNEGCSLDEILMVTFTDAAAAEMRKRIRARLAEKVLQSSDVRMARRLEEQ